MKYLVEPKGVAELAFCVHCKPRKGCKPVKCKPAPAPCPPPAPAPCPPPVPTPKPPDVCR